MRKAVSTSLTLLAITMGAFGLTGCGSSNAVGSGVNLHGSGGGGNLSLGSTTTTGATGGGAGASSTTAAPTPSTAPPTTAAHVTATTAAPAAYVIHINGDSSGQPAFAPTNVAVYQGTTVEWINSDSKAHSVVSTDGSFSSPSIPPGGSWSWVANTTGRHDYADGTRPYATGTVEVAPR